MKITNTDGVNGPKKSKKSGKTSDGGMFDSLLGGADEAEGAGESSAAISAGSLEATGSLLSLQEVPAHTGSRRENLQQGRNSVDILDDLRRDLLLGEDNPRTLQRMREQQARLNAQSYDPSLKGVMEDIDLRLAVEIAKREMAMA